jgi:periplasmic copper chaperone A
MTVPHHFLHARHRSTRRRLHRPTAVLVLAAGIVLVTALPAAAHVTVSSPDARPGEEGKLVFSVPTESATASTTKVTVALPEATPLASVSTKPHPGWRVSTTQRKLAKPLESEGFTLTRAVATVTWTAAPGKGLGPGQFDEFELSVGPFPEKPGKLVMPVTQTYSDGQVIKWDQPTPASGKEPEHPAPTLDVEPATSAAAASDSSDDLARWLGAGGLLLGAVALLSALLIGRRRSRPVTAADREDEAV